MKRALVVVLFVASCVDPQSAETQFCQARPQLCPSDAGSQVDAGFDAGFDAGVDAGCLRDEEFDGGWSACSTFFEPLTSNPLPFVENGALVLHQEGPNRGWSNGNIGSLLSQRVTGNFVAETFSRVIVPDGGRIGAYTAAALLAVAPLSPTLNSRLVSVGSLDVQPDGGNIFGVLSQRTSLGISDFRSVANGQTEMVLRLCRVGNDFYAFTRSSDGGALSGFITQFIDSGVTLPEEVLVGPAAYNVGGITTRIEHDYFRISQDVNASSDCGRALP
ncbi:MAG: hypothetical protein JNM17_22215 [Archangium sp.]|nr:hypothetical protein [Archangium sp.]